MTNNPTKNLFDALKEIGAEHLEEYEDYDEFRSLYIAPDPKKSFAIFFNSLSEKERKDFQFMFSDEEL